MIRWVAVAALVVAVALGGVILRLQLKQARADLAAAEARIATFEEVARIHLRNVQRLEAAAAEAGALDRELQEGSGADAPLSDYLGRGVGRVWP